MGGKKKLSLKQMEQRQSPEGKKVDKKKEKTGLGEGARSGIIPLNMKDKNVMGEVKKIRVLTPYNVAAHFNVRMSIARNLLKQLEEHGLVKMVEGNHRLKIFKLTE